MVCGSEMLVVKSGKSILFQCFEEFSLLVRRPLPLIVLKLPRTARVRALGPRRSETEVGGARVGKIPADPSSVTPSLSVAGFFMPGKTPLFQRRTRFPLWRCASTATHGQQWSAMVSCAGISTEALRGAMSTTSVCRAPPAADLPGETKPVHFDDGQSPL